jgi:hypothetical protein
MRSQYIKICVNRQHALQAACIAPSINKASSVKHIDVDRRSEHHQCIERQTLRIKHNKRRALSVAPIISSTSSRALPRIAARKYHKHLELGQIATCSLCSVHCNAHLVRRALGPCRNGVNVHPGNAHRVL